MLRVRPWNRLGLTIRWINQEYVQEFPVGLSPPLHMPVTFGPIETAKPVDHVCVQSTDSCDLCNVRFEVGLFR